MAKSSVMLSVPQLVDLALNSPEMGVINFNMLHALLHVLVQQTDLANSTVEFRGDNGEKVQSLLSSMKPAQAVSVKEYVVNKEGTKPKKEDEQVTDGPAETVILVETVTESLSTPHVSVAFSKSHLKQLHDDIEDIKHRVNELMDLPSNLDLINASRDKSQPIVDMFQLLTLNKRITANEEGLTKMASMIEDLARQTEGPIKETKRLSTTSAGRGLVERLHQMEVMLGVAESTGDDKKMNVYEEVMNIKMFLNKLPMQISTGTENVRTSVASPITTDTSFQPKPTTTDSTTKPTTDSTTKPTTDSTAKPTTTPTTNLPEKPAIAKPLLSAPIATDIKRHSQTSALGSETMTSMIKKFEDCSIHIQSLDSMFHKEMSDMQDHIHALEELVSNIMEKFKVGCDTSSGSEISTGEMHNKMMQMQTDVENLVETANKLIADKEGREVTFNAMLEQIELLKTIKADREDLEDALADKADACAVNRKVSHDQFDAACDDLSKGIEEALAKLTQQEVLWQQALDEIQRELSNKLDKSELLPLRDFINNKLKLLQDRLKDLSKLKKEAEAAGVKSKYLKDVNCISCDKDVVMRKQLDPATMPKAYAMPPGKSMAPYLAYELDNLRKQQKCFPHGRNLNNFEKATNIPKGGEDHICNRYCGGSHTITTPQQRVTRLGHFVQQWGPGVLPIGEGVTRGTDGQMYKTSEPDQSPQQRISLVIQGEGAVSPRKSGEGDASATAKDRRPSKRPSSEKPLKSSKLSLTKVIEGKQASLTRRASAGSKRISQASVKTGREGEQEPESKSPETIQEQSEGENLPQTEEGTIAPSEATEGDFGNEEATAPEASQSEGENQENEE